MEVKNEDIDTVLENFKKYLMPAGFTDIKAQIKKYGSDFDDDEIFLFLTAAVIREHESLWTDGKYQKELEPISSLIRQEEQRYGLQDDEYWPINEGPPEVEVLNKQYNSILDEKLILLFKKYRLDDFANFLEKDKKSFYERFDNIKSQLKGRGDSLKKIYLNLEKEAEACASIQAYNAASILLSSAIEGLLLETAMNNSDFCLAFIKFNKNRKKDREKSWVSLTLSELITLYEQAKIFPFREGDEIGAKMLDLAKDIRNLIHPGRRLAAKVHNISEDEYAFLFYIYMKLKSHYYPDN